MEQIDFAYFVGDPRRKKDLVSLHLANREDPFRVKAAIPLHPIDYENFCQDMTVSRRFLEAALFPGGVPGVWDCVLVYNRKQPNGEGILVVPGADGYVDMAAFMPTIKARWLEGPG